MLIPTIISILLFIHGSMEVDVTVNDAISSTIDSSLLSSVLLFSLNNKFY